MYYNIPLAYTLQYTVVHVPIHKEYVTEETTQASSQHDNSKKIHAVILMDYVEFKDT